MMHCQALLLFVVAFNGLDSVDCFSPSLLSRLSSRGSYHDQRGSFCPPWQPKLFQSASVETTSFSNSTTSSSSSAETINTATTANDTTTNSSSTSPATSLTGRQRPQDRKYDMPWGENQIWAMKDHLEKYTFQVHVLKKDGRDALQVYSQWRTLSNDVTALSGYPLQFLVDRYQEMKNNQDIKVETSTEILPYIDGFLFESDGGVSGRVYGIAGVAEGTRIHTTPVANVESTLQKGYILTQEGIVYELGLPANKANPLDGGLGMKRAERAASSIQSAVASSTEFSDVVMENQELAKLGALTAFVISGAWAMEALSHHLTVNVFWV